MRLKILTTFLKLGTSLFIMKLYLVDLRMKFLILVGMK